MKSVLHMEVFNALSPTFYYKFLFTYFFSYLRALCPSSEIVCVGSCVPVRTPVVTKETGTWTLVPEKKEFCFHVSCSASRDYCFIVDSCDRTRRAS